MRIIRERPKAELINITPLIDVVFILLVFFMLAGNIEPEDAFPVDPAATTAEQRGDIQDIVILVDADGTLALGDQVIERDDLTEVIAREIERRPDALIQLKPDAEAKATELIAIMEDIRLGGAAYIVLLTVGAPAVSGA